MIACPVRRRLGAALIELELALQAVDRCADWLLLSAKHGADTRFQFLHLEELCSEAACAAQARIADVNEARELWQVHAWVRHATVAS